MRYTLSCSPVLEKGSNAKVAGYRSTGEAVKQSLLELLCPCRIVLIRDPTVDVDQPGIFTGWATTSALWAYWASGNLAIGTPADGDWNRKSLKLLQD